jgi:hypothetical protein
MTHRDGNSVVSDLAAENIGPNRPDREWTLTDLLNAALGILDDDPPPEPPATRPTLRVIEGGKRSA